MARVQGFRERSEELERASLSTWAVLSAETKGRDRHEDPDPLRTAFQVDVHRILRCYAFHALSGKSAWLPAGAAPTCLTVTLEVARLADTLARALRLNADLAYAIALGHDLGATPFGQAGAAALAGFGYDPREQATRVVERLEAGGAGLNLTWETRDGILSASGPGQPATAEGQAVRLVAAIARATLHPAGADATRDATVRARLGDNPRGWGDALVADAVSTSAERPEVRLSRAGQTGLESLQAAVDAAEQRDESAVAAHHQAVHCVQSLSIYALEHGAAANDSAARQRVVDELAGSTDRDTLAVYRERFEPLV